MKAIMISIQPQYVEKILNGGKTIEIRKTKPSCELPCKVYIYCSKSKYEIFNTLRGIEHKGIHTGYLLNGKVVAEFILNKVDILERDLNDWLPKNRYDISNELLKDINLNQEQLWNYGQGKTLYAWNIDDLKVYDKPKPLQVFFRPCGDCDKKDTDRCIYEDSYCRAKVIRPPKSYCYVEELENE